MEGAVPPGAALKAALAREAQAAGFAKMGVCRPDAIPQAAGRLDAFLAAGRHGQMGWMAERAAWRRDPAALWPAARSVVMLAESYTPDHDPLDDVGLAERGAVSVYAQGRDYHDVVKKRLKRLARWLAGVAEAGGFDGPEGWVAVTPVREASGEAPAGRGMGDMREGEAGSREAPARGPGRRGSGLAVSRPGLDPGPRGDMEPGEEGETGDREALPGETGNRVPLSKTQGASSSAHAAKPAVSPVKVFVDTAPVMEKPLAQAAGLGWQGKHTNLLGRDLGNWIFLGAIFTTFDLPPDRAETEHCGSCRKCLDICPTDAFPAPFELDARRCISYLTIEHRGPVDESLRPGIGNRIYGCDDCLAICPWNKFAVAGRDMRLAPAPGRRAPELAALAGLDDAGFRAAFSGSPIKRIGRDRFVRNVCYAIGNSGRPALGAALGPLVSDPDPGVADAARWAKIRLETG
ncbi:epoxyqueuosine reductase [Palleronia aestuarii]|uniref:Epoxyqueuosine reductase n=1 Tax=Palleronia aestuarii TaxID=568105 RepID=A0A2W7NKL7_9RHOB|nr:tRNA epoxyqueuosine(34) reductase QueG [Palleronia aestuarii]PZX11842.1 epoxyqueuosine reductase [Palleronia aestuarii]